MPIMRSISQGPCGPRGSNHPACSPCAGKSFKKSRQRPQDGADFNLVGTFQAVRLQAKNGPLLQNTKRHRPLVLGHRAHQMLAMLTGFESFLVVSEEGGEPHV